MSQPVLHLNDDIQFADKWTLEQSQIFTHFTVKSLSDISVTHKHAVNLLPKTISLVANYSAEKNCVNGAFAVNAKQLH